MFVLVVFAVESLRSDVDKTIRSEYVFPVGRTDDVNLGYVGFVDDGRQPADIWWELSPHIAAWTSRVICSSTPCCEHVSFPINYTTELHTVTARI